MISVHPRHLPSKTLTVHNTSVTSMVLKHRVDRQQVSQVMRPKPSQHKSTTSLRTVQVENTESVKEKSVSDMEMLETGGIEKEVFGKPDDRVYS
jgi:hypothetical protein